jgi:hypothetical protein
VVVGMPARGQNSNGPHGDSHEAFGDVDQGWLGAERASINNPFVNNNSFAISHNNIFSLVVLRRSFALQLFGSHFRCREARARK